MLAQRGRLVHLAVRRDGNVFPVQLTDGERGRIACWELIKLGRGAAARDGVDDGFLADPSSLAGNRARA